MTQETNSVLMHLTFDFFLMQLKAPPEYEGLGTSLSQKCKLNAEENSIHVTAQQLGALSADDLPRTPILIRT